MLVHCTKAEEKVKEEFTKKSLRAGFIGLCYKYQGTFEVSACFAHHQQEMPS